MRDGFYFSSLYLPPNRGVPREPPSRDLLAAAHRLSCLRQASTTTLSSQSSTLRSIPGGGDLSSSAAQSVGSWTGAGAGAGAGNSTCQLPDRTVKEDAARNLPKDQLDEGIAGSKVHLEDGVRGVGAGAAPGPGLGPSSVPPGCSGGWGRPWRIYETESMLRDVIIDFLRAATLPLGETTPSAQLKVGSAVTKGGGMGERGKVPAGVTALELLGRIVNQPVGVGGGSVDSSGRLGEEGQSSRGALSLAERRFLLYQLPPSIERHLQWLVKDGLAAIVVGSNKEEALGGTRADHYVALPCGKRRGLASSSTNGGAGVREGQDPRESRAQLPEHEGASAVSEQPRTMRSRPLKMVKPWRVYKPQ
ncbi:unnamed protein product [Choristocarpus tenellus]